MSETVKVRALVNLPYWHRIEDGARMLRGAEGTIRIGDGEGDVGQADYEGKLELGMVAIVRAAGSGRRSRSAPASDSAPEADDGGDDGVDGGGEAAE
jgi:hypothetical protein